MLANKLMGGSAEKLYVDDVFSTYLYTGNDSTQTINNGIDLAGEGGLVWRKNRSGSASFPMHQLIDTVRGVQSYLRSELTQQAANNMSGYEITSFNNNGFTLGLNNGLNQTNVTYTSWTFRRAPKFFDIVTYTGNGVAGRQIPHGLGCEPGMIVVKRTDASGYNWTVYHISTGNSGRLNLNDTSAFITNASSWNNTNPTDTTFTLGVSGDVNASGGQYVAYLFAHDPSADGIVQCGSFTADASGNATVDLGWEPQYVMWKRADGTEGWTIGDVMRGMPASAAFNLLYANSSQAENVGAISIISPTATGFALAYQSVSAAYIYLAIRRPNKPPTSGTEVYNAIARTGTAAAATVSGVGFAPDLILTKGRSAVGANTYDRLRGPNKELNPSTTESENSRNSTVTAFTMDGFSVGTDESSGVNANTYRYVHWNFRRAPGFFDVVCYTGTGVARSVPHSLGVEPELMIVKWRNGVYSALDWVVYHAGIGTQYLNFNLPNAAMGGGVTPWNATAPSSSVFTLDSNGLVNASTATYVAYLFASLPGVSKVGSYTGNGTSQVIPCGFTTGARFVLIKRTDSTGDWMIADTARGIVAAADPRLSLNSTAAEVIGEDWLDPDPTGFIVNQVAGSNANVSDASYIFLAIA